MAEYRCPQHIFDLYEVDQSACFKAAFEWTTYIIDNEICKNGDIVIVPAKDGGEMRWQKGARLS